MRWHRRPIRTGKELTAVMVGAGDDLEKYKEQVKRLGLDARVSFHDPMPARQAFAMARAIVVPSRAEAMPYIVLEAVAAGYDHDSHPGRRHTRNSWDHFHCTLRCQLQQGIAEKMVMQIREPDTLAAAMPSLRAFLKQKFGVDVMARQIEQQYRAILEA
jgi:hypothetical protein